MAYVLEDEFKGPFEVEDDEDLAELNPDLRAALELKASDGLEKAGIPKSDSRHADLLELELLLNLAKLKEDVGGNQRIRSLKIADLERAYGARAPQAIAAMGLQHRDLPSGKSKQTQILNYLLKKSSQEQKAKERSENVQYKKDYLTALTSQAKEKKIERATKAEHGALNKRISNDVKGLGAERKEILAIHKVRPTRNYAIELLKIDKFMKKFEDIKLDKDAESKAERTRALERVISNEMRKGI